ncbi:tyrosine-type recombinase/integrase [Pseudomonas sp. TMW22091]|uniref:tyrosine-type recombinase/integrase n=1 Tax=Pseudomonas sp. TMW22091 TaxID=2506435 RepID=UPI00300C6E5A
MSARCNRPTCRRTRRGWISCCSDGAGRARWSAGLQRRDDIVSWLKSSVDIENNTIKVSPGKTQGHENPIHLQIKMGKALREVVSECLRSPVASPYLIHYRPKARKREQIAAKDHWTSVTPNYLSNEFSKTRDAAHAYDHSPATERPTFHEIRALGAWLYEQQNFPQEYIQALMAMQTRR